MDDNFPFKPLFVVAVGSKLVRNLLPDLALASGSGTLSIWVRVYLKGRPTRLQSVSSVGLVLHLPLSTILGHFGGFLHPQTL